MALELEEVKRVAGPACFVGAALLLTCSAAAIVAGAALTEAPAGANKWVDQEKVRCLSYYNSFPQGKEKELLRKAQDLGFNSIIAMGNTIDETTEKALALASRQGIHVFIAFHLRDALRAAASQAAVPRRFTGEDGVVDPNHPCPFDQEGWNAALGTRAVTVAKLSTKYPAAAGILFDIEDYAKRERRHRRGWLDHCYCDQCFESFCRARGLSVDSGAVPANKRKDWLTTERLFPQYQAYQHQEAERICRRIREEIDRINPDLLVACYPWGDSNYFEDYIRGLGTRRAPFLLFDYHYRGYKPNFALRAEELIRKGLHIRFVPGQGCFIGVDLGPVWTAAHCYYSAVANDGYWVYEGVKPILLEQVNWGGSVPGTPAQWEQWFRTANEDLDRRRQHPDYESTLPLPRDPLLDLTLRNGRNVRQAIPEAELRPLRHSPGAEIRFQKLTDLGIPWAGQEILLRGAQTGDYLEFEAAVSVTDTYSVEVFAGTGPQRGIVQLRVDGKRVGDPVDLYSPKLDLFPRPNGWIPRGNVQLLAPLGQATLEAGAHVFRLELVGRNPASQGYEVGIRGLMLAAVTDAPFVTEWLVIGPFPGGDYYGLATPFPPEREIALDKTYKGGITLDRIRGFSQPDELKWKLASGSAEDWAALQRIGRAKYSLSTATGAEADAWLDFRRVLGSDSGVAYALTWVHSPRARWANVLLSAPCGTRMWVNGKLVWKFEVSSGVVPLPSQVAVPLKAGANEVLVKAEQNWHWPWGIHLRFSDPSRELTYDTRGPRPDPLNQGVGNY